MTAADLSNFAKAITAYCRATGLSPEAVVGSRDHLHRVNDLMHAEARRLMLSKFGEVYDAICAR